MNIIRERFNTKLRPDIRMRLRLLTAQYGFKSENEFIEYLIENTECCICE